MTKPIEFFCDFCRQSAWLIVKEDSLICKTCSNVRMTKEALNAAEKVRVAEFHKMLASFKLPDDLK